MRYKSAETMDRIVSFIESFFFKEYRTPSISEIAAAVGHSKSTVHAYLLELGRQGRIQYERGTIGTPATRKFMPHMTMAPVLGSVACGAPQYEEENFEAYVALPNELFGSTPSFILRAKGESMIEAGIEPGDLVLVTRQDTAEDGDIVVALVDGETTLKRFYYDRENRRFRLHPENSAMEDIIVSQCYIQGVARNVIKRLT